MNGPPLAEPVPLGDRYLLLRRLATGGVADIFLARQSATAGFEKEIVIKRLRPELRGNARVVKRFLEEARIGALLNHPNVVHVYDVDVAEGAPYIAMEYIVGGELGALCRRGLAQKSFLPLPHAVELVRQAAAGLGYLHAKRGADGQPLGIVHRDLSPNNLMITEDGFLKIIDFGIAKTRRTEAAVDQVLPGVLGYMAPEQILRGPIDVRADIFSLGVVLYEITLGRRLFKGPAHEVVRRISGPGGPEIEPPTSVRPGYPAPLEAIAMRALARDPDARYQSAYDLADELEEFLHAAKLASGPVRIARYLDELGHAEGRTRRPELSTSGRAASESGVEIGIDAGLGGELFSSFRAAPGREWDDAEEPIADVASALGLDVAELRTMRVPAAAPEGSDEGRAGRARRATGDLRNLRDQRDQSPPIKVNGSHVLPMGLGADERAAKDAGRATLTDDVTVAPPPAAAAAPVAAGPAAAGPGAAAPAALSARRAAASVAGPSPQREELFAALLHRAPPPHQRWVVIGISVAVLLFVLYLIVS